MNPLNGGILRTITGVFIFLLPVLAFSQRKQTSIRIIQDHSFLLDTYESSLSLERKSFKIQVFLDNVKGVYCYAAFSDSIYKLGEKDAVPGFASLPELSMAETPFNKEKELLISNEGWSYWFYDTETDWHRFNKKIILIDSNSFVGTKSIRQLYFVETQKETKLKDIRQPLYLFFVAVEEFDAQGKPLKELMRRKVKIEWTNDK